jgi:hypothetical protein
MREIDQGCRNWIGGQGPALQEVSGGDHEPRFLGRQWPDGPCRGRNSRVTMIAPAPDPADQHIAEEGRLVVSERDQVDIVAAVCLEAVGRRPGRGGTLSARL